MGFPWPGSGAGSTFGAGVNYRRILTLGDQSYVHFEASFHTFTRTFPAARPDTPQTQERSPRIQPFRQTRWRDSHGVQDQASECIFPPFDRSILIPSMHACGSRKHMRSVYSSHSVHCRNQCNATQFLKLYIRPSHSLYCAIYISFVLLKLLFHMMQRYDQWIVTYDESCQSARVGRREE